MGNSNWEIKNEIDFINFEKAILVNDINQINKVNMGNDQRMVVCKSKFAIKIAKKKQKCL